MVAGAGKSPVSDLPLQLLLRLPYFPLLLFFLLSCLDHGWVFGFRNVEHTALPIADKVILTVDSSTHLWGALRVRVYQRYCAREDEKQCAEHIHDRSQVVGVCGDCNLLL